MFKFTTDYLNEHFIRNADQGKRIILTKEDLTCAAQCGEQLKRGDWIFSKHANGKLKKYHLKCAFRLLILSKKEAKDYMAAKTIFALVMAFWAIQIFRQSIS